jgi:RecA/RadA recombinase
MAFKNELMASMAKNSSIGETAVLSQSELFKGGKLTVDTEIPMFNVAFSGDLDIGFAEDEQTIIAGQSRHFKTLFGLILAKRYLDKYPEAFLLFCDNEFGTHGKDYFISVGIDPERVLHVPIENLEELHSELVKHIKIIKRNDKVFIFIDSIGNVASLTEVANAEEEHIAEDVGRRQKKMKSVFRTITPMLAKRKIPLVAINHTYKTMEKYSKEIVSSGQGPFFAASNILVITRESEKGTGVEEKEVVAFNYKIKIEKSRSVKEGIKIPIKVWRTGAGLDVYSGLLDEALASGHVVKPKKGWYASVNMETGEVSEKSFRERQLNNEAFWAPILADQKFKDFIRNKYMLVNGSILGNSDDEEMMIDDDEDDGEE